MSTAAPTAAAVPLCPICDQPTNAGLGACPNCGTSADWLELIEAQDFALRRFTDWRNESSVTAAQHEKLTAHYQQRQQEAREAARARRPFAEGTGLPPADQCWNCRSFMNGVPGRCQDCGVVMQSPAVRSLRAWKFLEREIKKHEQAGVLSLYQAHDYEGRVRGCMAALRTRLSKDRARVEPRPAAARESWAPDFDTPRGPYPANPLREPRIRLPRRSLMEILVDPQSIQWLLASGGVLLVVGLVIWLTSLGLFDNPGVVAVAMGLGNGLLLLGGWAIIKYTRYQLAGRSLTLLACLVMPLNLWFYHAHNLITLQGHLWVAALMCCAIYAASALVLRDQLFVYVLCGGLALTGLLFLGTFGRLEEILAPAALLVILGLIALHAERAFPEGEGPFARHSFGLAFFWSAQALLGAGLLFLLGGQLIGWLHLSLGGLGPPAVVDRANLPWTLLLVIAGTYAYIYSDLVVRRIGVYIHFAAITILWAEIQLLVLLNVSAVEPVVVLTLTLTALAANVAYAQFGKDQHFLRSVPFLAMLLTLLPVVHGVLLHYRATNQILLQAWPFAITWTHVAAMVVAALCARAGAFLYRHDWPQLSALYFAATAASTLVAAAGALWLWGLKPWETQAPLLMAIPIAYLIAARLYRGHSPEEPLIWVAHASTAIMLVSSLWVALRVTPQVAPVQAMPDHTVKLLLAIFCAEAALFYALAALVRQQGWNVYLATAMLCGALWQLLSYWNAPDELYTVAFAVTGFVLLIAYRLAVLESTKYRGLTEAAFQSANALMLLGFVAGAMLTLTRLLSSDAELTRLGDGDMRAPIKILIYLLIMLAVLSLLAAWLVGHPVWRRVYLVLAICEGALVLFAFHRMSLLSPWQKLEIFSIVIGAGLLAFGLWGWYREQDQENDMVTFCLVVGSLLVAAPLIIASMIYRFGWTISALNEFGLVLASVLLFGAGVVCRLKSTTIVGAASMAIYLIMVIVYMHRFLKDQVIVGIYLTLGGALLFGTGLLLSVYRDRLLALPEKIKRREGIFKILTWR